MTPITAENLFYRVECTWCGKWYAQKHSKCPSCKHINEDYKLNDHLLRGQVDKGVDKTQKKGDT